MKRHVEGLVRQALSAAIEAGELRVPEAPAFAVEVPSDPRFGDLSTNAALVLARAEGRPPHAIAGLLVGRFEAAAPAGWLQGPPEVAGPGFINFRLAPAFWQRMLADALAAGDAYGRSMTGAGRRAQVEFVSANPTGPLTVGHGRNAVIGDTLARLLAADGWQVEREYYFNNAGRQMKVLAESVRARYLELIGRAADFPEDGYQGEYIRDIARGLVERHGAALATDDGTAFRAAAEQSIFAAIRATLARSFDAVIDVFGADHIAEHQEVAAALRALGVDAARVRAVIYQFVTLTRHGEQVKMSTRRAEYVTLDELLDEVGVDAARFFFLMRKSDSHLEFDLDLAKQQSTDNPVFYVQYAHARIASVLRQAAEAGIALAPAPDLSPLGAPEVEVVRAVASWPDVVESAARDLEPHRIVFHALDLAGAFHRYYNRQRILTEDRTSTQARLALVRAVQQVLRGALGLAGVTAPERM